MYYAYVDKEGYNSVYPLLVNLKERGLMPKAITLDGHTYVIKAILDAWPNIIIQRCLYHIQREGLRWLRTYPKTEAGKALKVILKSLAGIKNIKNQKRFMENL